MQNFNFNSIKKNQVSYENGTRFAQNRTILENNQRPHDHYLHISKRVFDFSTPYCEIKPPLKRFLMNPIRQTMFIWV